MDLGLEGKVAIVTGGASGMGQATSTILAQERAKVILADIHDDKGKAAAEKIRKTGGEATFIHADVSSQEEVEQLVDKVLEMYGTIDILCNFAGIGGVGYDWPNISSEEWDLAFNVHMRGTFLCTQEVSRRAMIPNHSGKIVNIGSLSAHGWRGPSAYSAAKAAIVGFSRNAAIGLGPHGINVNVVCPGNVGTPMTRQLMDPESEGYKSVRESTLLKIVGDAMSIAPIVVFLCSEPAHYITGADINASAGQVIY